MKSLAFFGCSWTYGIYAECDGSNRFTKMISSQLNVEENNYSKNGNSNYDIVNTVVDVLTEKHFDVCVIQFTGLHRITIPIQDTLKTLRASDSSRNPTQIGNFIGYQIFSSNKKHEIYGKYYYNQLHLLHNYCLSKNILPVFCFLDDLFLDYVSRQQHNFNIIPVSLKSMIPEKENAHLYVDPTVKIGGHHPNDYGHIVLSDILIQEIKKFIPV
jgi:hypothetical protein